MNKPHLYRLDAVTQSYSGRPVLQIDRLDVAEGEILCLLGPTGAGKSTLLRLLAALERRDVEMRRQAWQVLQGLLGESASFDPYAPEAQRRQEIARLRDHYDRKAG